MSALVDLALLDTELQVWTILVSSVSGALTCDHDGRFKVTWSKQVISSCVNQEVFLSLVQRVTELRLKTSSGLYDRNKTTSDFTRTELFNKPKTEMLEDFK